MTEDEQAVLAIVLAFAIIWVIVDGLARLLGE